MHSNMKKGYILFAFIIVCLSVLLVYFNHSYSSSAKVKTISGDKMVFDDLNIIYNKRFMQNSTAILLQSEYQEVLKLNNNRDLSYYKSEKNDDKYFTYNNKYQIIDVKYMKEDDNSGVFIIRYVVGGEDINYLSAKSKIVEKRIPVYDDDAIYNGDFSIHSYFIDDVGEKIFVFVSIKTKDKKTEVRTYNLNLLKKTGEISNKFVLYKNVKNNFKKILKPSYSDYIIKNNFVFTDYKNGETNLYICNFNEKKVYTSKVKESLDDIKSISYKYGYLYKWINSNDLYLIKFDENFKLYLVNYKFYNNKIEFEKLTDLNINGSRIIGKYQTIINEKKLSEKINYVNSDKEVNILRKGENLIFLEDFTLNYEIKEENLLPIGNEEVEFQTKTKVTIYNINENKKIYEGMIEGISSSDSNIIVSKKNINDYSIKKIDK